MKKSLRVRATVDDAQNFCTQALRELDFQVTIFGCQRRLLCVRRLYGTNQAIRIEVAVEAISKDDTRINISAEYGNEALNETILRCQMVDIAQAIERAVSKGANMEVGFPLRLMQVCIW